MRALVEKLARAGDDAWQEQRDRIYREWQEDLAVLMQEQFDFLWPRIADVEARVAQLCEDASAERLHANYANAAASEVTPERRRMLAYADAALIDTRLTIAQHARAERLLRELDPEDVLWLSVIDRAAGTFFEQQQLNGEERVRWAVWNKAGADILAASGCVRVTHHGGNAGFGGGSAGWDGVSVTREGRMVLHVMRLFVRASDPPMIPPGHEPRPGDRTEQDAWGGIHSIDGLRGAAIRLGAAAPARYDFPKVDFRTGRPGSHDAKAILYLRGATPDEALGLGMAAPMQHDPMHVSIGSPIQWIQIDASADDTAPGKCQVRVHGPHDVLRWLADEVDARWT